MPYDEDEENEVVGDKVVDKENEGVDAGGEEE